MIVNILIIIIAITALISISAFNNQDLKYRFMFIPARIQETGEKYRFFSHIFIHADYAHLLFNMLSLYFLGDLLLDVQGGDYMDESGKIFNIQDGWIQKYGFWGGQIMFAALYFAGGLFATIIPYSRHKNNSSYMSLGASGAVSAVIFAAILWNPTVPLRLLFFPFPMPAYVLGLIYIAYEIYMDKRGNTGVAHDAHLGGAIFGIVFVLFTNIDAGKRFIDLIF